MKWVLLFCAIFVFLPWQKIAFYQAIPFALQPCEFPMLANQRFTYLGEGAQVYAFENDSHTLVLKIFKATHKKRFRFSRLFFKGKEAKAISGKKWDFKFAKTCQCYELAFKKLKEECGLIALHLQKTKKALPVILQISSTNFVVDLSSLPFILQKKALLLPTYLKHYPEKKGLAQQKLKDFFLKRLTKGINDPAQSLSINYGFINDEPMQIDVGKIEEFSGNYQIELQKIYDHIDAWFSKL